VESSLSEMGGKRIDRGRKTRDEKCETLRPLFLFLCLLFQNRENPFIYCTHLRMSAEVVQLKKCLYGKNIELCFIASAVGAQDLWTCSCSEGRIMIQ
jgi:hypothetical protein